MDLSSHFAKAQRLLGRRDKVLGRLIKLVGPCTLQIDPDHFGVLARSIISQQISTKAARAISSRLEKALGRRGIHPRAVQQASDDVLRGAGLSANKTRSLRDLADRILSGGIPLNNLHTMPDDAVIEHLVPVHGIGRWTAEMFLIFALGRLDVLPVGDYGLRAGVQRHYGLSDLPDRRALAELAEPWKPYRTIGTWFIWRSLGNVPQSDG